MQKFLSVLDFAVRFVFFAAAPFVIALTAALFPITGALVQVALALGVFFVADRARRLAARSRIASLVIGTQLEFEEYYREHPPHPFLYYVFYPVFFPYWLVSQRGRREFWLYKGYTLASLAFLFASLVIQFFMRFPPELGLRDFYPIALGTFFVESVIVLVFLMPIVTTVVHFHTIRAPRRLGVLLAVGVLSVASAIVVLERRRDPIVSFATRTRVRLRSKKDAASAARAQTAALEAAWKLLAVDRSDIERDGKVEGAPLDAAHAALEPFYKHDEAYAFDLWYSRTKGTHTLVLYFEAKDKKPPIWLAMEGKGSVTSDSKKLPRGAFVAMKHAADL
jgi:hypothetical protein